MTIVYKTEDWQYQPDAYGLTYSNIEQTESLDPKSGRLLVFLIKNRGSVISRREIYKELFGFDSDRSDGTITAYVSKLRKLLETVPAQKGKYIKTISKSGYQFVGQVETIDYDNSLVETSEDKQGNSPVLAEPSNIETFESFNSLQQPTPTVNNEIAGTQKRHPRNIFGAALVLFAFIFGWQLYSKNPSDANWQINQSGFITNDAVSMSQDGSLVALIEKDDKKSALVVRKSHQNKSRQIHVLDNQSNDLTSPTFSTDGQHIAFAERSHSGCQIYEVAIDTTSLEPTNAAKVLVEVPGCLKAPQLAYIDNSNLLYLKQGPLGSPVSIMLFDKQTNQSRPAMETDGDSERVAYDDYWFALDEHNQTMAFLRLQQDNSTAVYRFNFITSELHHIVTVPGKLEALDWLTQDSLIVMQDRHLKMIDIQQKNIVPVNFAQVRKKLNNAI